MDPKKIKAIVSQQDLKSITGFKLFLGFCNYYRKFIAKWLDKTEPFTKMTKKNEFWNWDNKKKNYLKKSKTNLPKNQF